MIKIKPDYLNLFVVIVLLLGNFLIKEIDNLTLRGFAGVLFYFILAFIYSKICKSTMLVKFQLRHKFNINIILGLIGIYLIGYSTGNLGSILLNEEIGSIVYTNPFIILVLQIICLPFVEELLFRRCILVNSVNRYGERKALWISSIIFTIAHFFTSSGLLFVFMGSMFLGYLYLKTNSFYVVLLYHILLNVGALFLSPIVNEILIGVSRDLVTFFLTGGLIIGIIFSYLFFRRFKI